MRTKRNSASKSSNARRSNRPDANTLLRSIPSVDELIVSPPLSDLVSQVGRPLVVGATRSALAALRLRISEHPEDAATKMKRGELAELLIGEVIADVESSLRPSLRPVINATGVV